MAGNTKKKLVARSESGSHNRKVRTIKKVGLTPFCLSSTAGPRHSRRCIEASRPTRSFRPITTATARRTSRFIVRPKAGGISPTAAATRRIRSTSSVRPTTHPSRAITTATAKPISPSSARRTERGGSTAQPPASSSSSSARMAIGPRKVLLEIDLFLARTFPSDGTASHPDIVHRDESRYIGISCSQFGLARIDDGTRLSKAVRTEIKLTKKEAGLFSRKTTKSTERTLHRAANTGALDFGYNFIDDPASTLFNKSEPSEASVRFPSLQKTRYPISQSGTSSVEVR
jgi:hypothetical protein